MYKNKHTILKNNFFERRENNANALTLDKGYHLER
jgi:hypothetical protein